MARRDETPRDLLLGLLALRNGLIDPDQLVAAFEDWSRAGGKALAEVLVWRGAIDEEERALLSAMAEKQLRRHGGDARTSLAAVPAEAETVGRLADLGDADLSTSLGLLSARPRGGGGRAVGPATSDGRRFRVLRHHARGGLGAVYVALDAELNREVALKQILDRHADDPGSRARFVVEAEITGGLEHPGIVPVYGLGHHDGGRPYYAMRFIRGDSLKEAIAAFHGDGSLKLDAGKRSLALRGLLRRFVDVCNAVDYAHGRGVVHRDLKPGNVIVGKHGETLVVDWGLAKPIGRPGPGRDADEWRLMTSPGSASAETLPGSAIGTPAYMSPEQARGDLEALGPRSDVYSLGATLYCLLTGRPPFAGEDVETVLEGVREGAFPPPRHAAPAVDRALEAICLKAMATRPEARHETARALADDLERWAADEPTSAWREPPGVRARRWMRRNRTAVAAAGAALIAAVLGLAGVLAVQTRARSDLEAKNAELAGSIAREGAANARVRARFDLAREAIRSFQAGVNEDEMLRGEELKGLRDKLLRSAAGFYRRLETLLRGQDDRASRATLARSYFELGELTERVGDQPEALAAHRLALAIRRELAGPPGGDAPARLDLARSLEAVGGLAEAKGGHREALAAFEEARELAEGSGATDEARELVGTGHLLIGGVLAETGRAPEALASYREALTILRGLARADPAVARYRGGLANVHNDVGILLSEAGRPDEALASYREALAIREALARDNPAVNDFRDKVASSHNNIANLLRRAGRADEALASYREALVIQARLSRENPAVTDYRSRLARSHGNLGVLLSDIGRPDEALASYREALAIREALTRDHPSVNSFRAGLAINQNNLGVLHADAGRKDQAFALYREALANRRKLVADNPSVTKFRDNLAESHQNIANLLQAAGRVAEALESHREALAIYRKLAAENPTVVPFRSDLADNLFNLGVFHEETGRAGEAMEAHREALAIREAISRGDPAAAAYRERLARSHHNVGDLDAGAGRTAGAVASYAEALANYRRLAEEHPGVGERWRDLASAHVSLGKLRAGGGDPAGAIADYRRAIAALENPAAAAESSYDLACGRSLLAGAAASPGSGIPAEEAEALALAAVEALRHAIEGGYDDLAELKADADLDPIRPRPDFQALLMDLAFPARPLGGATPGP